MLTITTPAADVALLTTEQLRDAAGLASGDTSQDTALAALGLRVAADIAVACDVSIGAGGPPTLLQETLTETFRCVRRDVLCLGRRHDVTITSVTVDDTLLDVSAYEVHPETGLLNRLSGSVPIAWCANLISVVYQAGFATVPADLEGAALDLCRLRLSEGSRDPMVRSLEEDVPGVMRDRTNYWVGGLAGGSQAGGVPVHIASRLSRFMNVRMG